MDQIDQLNNTMRAARRAYKARIEERDKYIRTAVDQQRALITAAAKDIYPDIDALGAAWNEAERLYNEQLDANVRAGVDARFPVGTVLYEWKRKHGFGSREYRWEKTGKSARYVGVTGDFDFPENLSDYSKPDRGTYVLRVIRKDGSDGKALVPRRDVEGYHPQGWKPGDKENE